MPEDNSADRANTDVPGGFLIINRCRLLIRLPQRATIYLLWLGFAGQTEYVLYS